MLGVGKHTVLRLLEDAGCACAAYHHRHVRGLRVRRLQCDEIWAFVGAKRKNVSPGREAEGWGDVWTWTAIDADTKLIVTYFIGDRGKGAAYEFMGAPGVVLTPGSSPRRQENSAQRSKVPNPACAKYVENTNKRGGMVPFCVLEPMFSKAAHSPKIPKTSDLPALANKMHERQ